MVDIAGPWIALCSVMAMNIGLATPIEGAMAPSRFPDDNFMTRASSTLSNAQKSQITEPMMFRYCTDTIPNDCDDFISANGQCVNLPKTVAAGSFLILYPSNRCYMYPKMRCQGTGNHQVRDRWYRANWDDQIVSSYRCFK